MALFENLLTSPLPLVKIDDEYRLDAIGYFTYNYENVLEEADLSDPYVRILLNLFMAAKNHLNGTAVSPDISAVLDNPHKLPTNMFELYGLNIESYLQRNKNRYESLANSMQARRYDTAALMHNMFSSALEEYLEDRRTNIRVVFYDYDGEIVRERFVEYGDSVSAPTMPQLEGMEFAGWSGSLDNITSNTYLTPIYLTLYRVRFFDVNHQLISEQQVASGREAIAPTPPNVSGSTFSRWSEDFLEVTSNLDIYALYSSN